MLLFILNNSIYCIVKMKKTFDKIRNISLIIFPLFAIHMASASSYYFSTSKGDDSRTSSYAQNPVTPWKTIDKLNAFFDNLKPGDSVLFHRGEIFYGSINAKRSGSSSLPIVVSCYGTGDAPVISAFARLSSWTLKAEGIYESTCASCVATDNILIINGNLQTLGRYPNKGYLSFQSHNGNKSISDKTLPDFPNWTGADIVIKKKHWIIDRGNITSQTSGIINYAGGTSGTPTDNYGYFIENDPRTLDQFGEWYFDSSAKKMRVFFGNANPSLYSVNASAENILVNINGQSFIEFKNLLFEGANINAFRIINSKNITVQNCRIDFSGTDAIYASGSSNLSIENSAIDHSQNDAITLDSICRSARIRNNLIRNTALMAGMGKNGTGTYQAISAFGESSIIEYNEIDSTGYNGIYFGGNRSTAKNNLIQYFCIVKDDGAGIYLGDWFPSAGKKIIGNIILNGVGSPEGTNTRFPLQVEGIYIDDNSADVDIQANSVVNCPHAGIMIHNAHNIKIEDNTIFNNSIQLLLQHDNLWPNSPIKDVSARRNIFFCGAAGQICLSILSPDDEIRSFGISDSNYYYRSTNDDVAIQTMTNIWTSKSAAKNFSVSAWQTAYNQDLNSKMPDLKISDGANIHFEYNASLNNIALPLKGYYIHSDSAVFANKFTLVPYGSVVFFKN